MRIYLFQVIKTITGFIIIMMQLDEQARESEDFMRMFESPDDNDTDHFENSSNFNEEYSTINYIIS